MAQRRGDGQPGIVLLQMGGPNAPGELGPFLRNLFTDPEMIRLPRWLAPLQPVLGRLYGTYRVRAVRDEYEAIGWSDLNLTTARLARNLEARLDGQVAGVETAMRYTPPRARAAVGDLLDAGADRLVGVTLYPFFSRATTGSSAKDLECALEATGPDLELDIVDRWGSHPRFIELQAAYTQQTIEQASEDRDDLGELAVLLSTHGIPEAYVADGDPYEEEVREGAGLLDDALDGVDRVELAFQSDVGPVEWLRPHVPDAIAELVGDGVDTLVIVPFGFVSEHIETLYEIDVEYHNHALSAGIDRVLRVPAFDAAPAFANLLAELVEDHLGAPA